MSPLWIAALGAAAVVTLGWHRHRRAVARQALCRDRFTALLEEQGGGLELVEPEPGRWLLQGDGKEPVALDRKALVQAFSGDDDRQRRLTLAVAEAALRGPRPFAGRFDLKADGARTLPRLADEGLSLLKLEPQAVRFTATGAAGIETIYMVDGEPQPVYVADEHLAAAGIDGRDLHGVAVAVLRQRFDPAHCRTALDGDEVVTIEPPDGCGSARLLLLPEALRQGENLFASAPNPGQLLIAADRGRLERALAELEEPARTLSRAVFRATSDGLRMES